MTPEDASAPTPDERRAWAGGILAACQMLSGPLDQIEAAGGAHPPAVVDAVRVLLAYAKAHAQNAEGQPADDDVRSTLGLVRTPCGQCGHQGRTLDDHGLCGICRPPAMHPAVREHVGLE